MTEQKNEVKLEDIVSLCKRRGFIFPGSDVYGGLAGTWDYGPLGVTLKRNIMNLWWKMFVTDREDMQGVDAAILMNQKVWQASGHVDTFTDPLTICKVCNSRQRIDKLINLEKYKTYINDVLLVLYDDQWKMYKERENAFVAFKDKDKELAKIIQEDFKEFEKLKQAGVKTEVFAHWLDGAKKRLDDHLANQETLGKTLDFRLAYLELLSLLLDLTNEARSYTGNFAKNYINMSQEASCPSCGGQDWTMPQKFNMMFKTSVGASEDESSISYLRPETAQGIFTNFKNVVDTVYPDVPFGIAQQGKAFRNEISPRDFVFRSREFEQMEVEYFVHPDQWEEAFEMWRKKIHEWFAALGLDESKVHELDVPADDLAHYSKRTIDFEFDFPHGKDELLGMAYRTDFDLMNIQNASGKSMEYRPKDGSPAYVPHVIEPSFGVERAVMAVLRSAYWHDTENDRVVLRLPYALAPVKAAVCPLAKNNPELVAKARDIYAKLKKEIGDVLWIDSGNIGKNYRKMDEIGVPYVVTVDFDTLEGDTKDTVTVRSRDTTTQERQKVSNLIASISAQ